MYKIDPQVRRQAVEYYLQHKGTTLKKVATQFHVHYLSLHKWVKQYHREGSAGILRTYMKPWNRFSLQIEEKIISLKEKDPRITVRAAQKRLSEQAINVSIKGIWGVWKRYGYSGFDRHALCPDFTEYCAWSSEATEKFKQAQALFEINETAQCAMILNTIPALPKNKLLSNIPDQLLNLRRRIEKMTSLYRTTPMRTYTKLLEDLLRECAGKDLIYSALRVRLYKIGALSFTGDPIKQLKDTEELESLLTRRDGYLSPLLFSLKFPALISEGIARAKISEINKASRINKHCYDLIRRRKHISASFIYELGSLCTWIEDFKKAEYCYLRSLSGSSDMEKQYRMRNLGFVLFHKGKYRKALRYLKSVREKGWGYDSKVLMCDAMYALAKGKPEDAIALTTKALSMSKKDELNIDIIMANSRIASAYCGLGQRKKGMTILKRILPFTRANFTRMTAIVEDIIAARPTNQRIRNIPTNLFPTARMIHFLKCGQYKKAYAYAQQKYLMTHFHQYVLFYPETVIKLLKRGKRTFLPRAMLRLPVFNKETPVYHIRFLGALRISKNNESLSLKITPRETAFIVHLALFAGEPGKYILVDKICLNFWKNSSHALRNLSHILLKIKKVLRIPRHLLVITRAKTGSMLCNRGIHFLTDKDEFLQILATAEAYERAGEKNLAHREYMGAFKLFRSAPFTKMYDEWSEKQRGAILNIFEKNALRFVEKSIQQGHAKEAQRIYIKLHRYIPQTQTFTEFTRALGNDVNSSP